MRHLLIPVTGYFSVTPDRRGDDVGLKLTPIVAIMPIYDGDGDDFTHVQLLTKDWDGVEPQDELVLRPDGRYLDRHGRVGNEQAALKFFRRDNGARYHVQQLGKRYARYSAKRLREGVEPHD
jgi:hypothetical protein